MICGLSHITLAKMCGFPHSLQMNQSLLLIGEHLGRRSARPWFALIIGWLIVSLITMTLAAELARRDALAELARRAEANAALHAAVLRSELEKQRSVPVVLAQDPDVAALLANPDPDAANRVSAKLESIAIQMRAAAIYVLDAQGLAQAASNWREPTSFVGSNYAFRPYFTDSLSAGAAEFFALGTVSGRPGLYLARRIGSSEDPLGVVVVKVEFDALEAEWRRTGEPAFVTDQRGVVLVTSEPSWRFRRSRELTAEEREAILEDQTLSGRALDPLPYAGQVGRIVQIARGPAAGEWMLAQTETDTPGWTLHLLDPVQPAIATATINARVIALLIVTLAATAVAVLWRRRQQGLARVQAEEAARADLERRIDDRTSELRDANSRLKSEIDERRRAEASREILREELVQASRLATLGQIAAGVAHEINQPVAAIRLHSETAAKHLERGDEDAARRNLDRVSSLTERIGTITDELRAFSRKAGRSVTSVSLAKAVDGALLLVGHRLRDHGVALQRSGLEDVQVMADPVRLEQVVINLLQNAFEALVEAQTPEPVIRLHAARMDDRIELVVSDNGPGIDPAIASTLFTPFVTTKAQGLGLGLVICRDIVAGFGGELSLKPSPEGTSFVIVLEAAR
jgi:two-component system C4-dicarboxylate transport sensor histidine kinase DctB